jgi:heptosyltransferase-1
MIKILIVRLSSIGDIIHTFPMIYDIKQHVKDCSIDWVVDENFVDVAKLNCNLNNVIGIPIRKLKKNKLRLIFSIIKWRKSLENISYDYIIDSQGLLKSALVANVFKGSLYGFNKSSIREKLACIFYKFRISVDKNCLAVNKNRQLSALIFNYQIDYNKVDFGVTKCPNITMNNLFTKNYVIIFHASSKKNKHYPIENWIRIIQHIIEKFDLAVVLPYGNLTEKNESFKIKDLLPQYSENIIIPEQVYSFNQIAIVINSASFVLGVDTGLIHLSNALNKKTIAIYTATNPSKTGIFASEIAINIGNINDIPEVNQINKHFDYIMK